MAPRKIYSTFSYAGGPCRERPPRVRPIVIPTTLHEITDGRIWDDPEVVLRKRDKVGKGIGVVGKGMERGRAWVRLQEPFHEGDNTRAYRRACQRKVIAYAWHKDLTAGDIKAAVDRWKEEREARESKKR